ncbi:MAG: DUF169 domain-containing protein [Candidatus Lokiarchaeota archaeon]|nr:DUF169 domain-containing protein [Candidatus Lokiarchaeota archaeon]
MNMLTIRNIALKLKEAGRLSCSPLCVYGSEIVPKKAVSINKINSCIANAIFSLSLNDNIESLFIGAGALEGCCPGGRAWFGYDSFLPQLKYFLSTGNKDFRGGACEFLLASPDIAERKLKAAKKIKPIGKFTVIQKAALFEENDIDVKLILCFGNSEQVRNLCSLAYFRPEENLSISIPWGPSCASFVTYPAGLDKRLKDNRIIVGPTDPTGNYWFPQNYLSIGIPFEIAKRMTEDLNASFISKRPKIAYPDKRLSYNN